MSRGVCHGCFRLLLEADSAPPVRSGDRDRAAWQAALMRSGNQGPECARARRPLHLQASTECHV